ncbi:DUF262 domain-containing protein [Leptospira levettii]|uniref:DUF262 domain-containing HNH endonuclease family protein n=1 Tax=Leptospira levettii TaxID=2023178 RepID=A0AAW5V9C3_9LEPT|nr:DUF262 domain-containing HNH endonuclease family protein [Leptospira levettii]MCW7467677.1 DUF262 domain-containing HNH endonuclease family protein [Leptospira levettii]MCW7513357.1 DUF262 domain-containing HNH endonuclease family protein [Leptospira levettii]MCW7517080.1 DUF262 domain-containing HNH endonuclease family protein [Leptospira levettii]
MSITKSQKEKIGSIFNGNRFIIPAYQRKYSWTDTERKALWQDIEESIKDNMNHFIGTLSFKENKAVGLSTDTLYEIIDGQQRITSLFILLKVLIDKIQDEATKKSQIDAFIGSKDNLKLQPQGVDGEFLSKLFFDFENIQVAEINKRSHNFMYSAKLLFSAFVNALKPNEIEDRIIFIRDRIEVLVFNVESQAQAVKMFSIINDRGLPLRILDKTKSILMLYSTVHLGEQLNSQINDDFEKIFDSYDDILVSRDKLGILGRLEENTIFTQHYYSAKRLFPGTWNNKDGAETIFKNLKTRCEELKNIPNELKEFINNYLLDFRNFAVSYSNLVKEIETNSIYQKPFRYLEFTATLYPLIVRLYMQKKLNSLLPLLEAIEVRVYKLRGTNPIADIYWLSSVISESELTVDEIKKHLINYSEKFVSNHVFRTYLDSEIYGNGSVKYIISEFTKDIFDIETYNDFQVEHIFSREPNYDVSSYGFAEDYDYEKNRLGNLGILESSLNKGLGNLPPINKVSGYLNSVVSDTRNLAGEIQKGNFRKENVDERRKLIIDFCIERFKLS